MADDVDKFVFRRPNQTFCVLRFAAGWNMQAGHHHVQFCEQFVVEIQPVAQNVHFGSGEQTKIAAAFGKLPVNLFDFLDLLANAFCVETIRLKRRLRMVGDRPVCQTKFFHVFGNFLKPIVAVTPRRVIVQRAFQIRPFDEPRQIVLFIRRKFSVIFTQFRRHKRQIQFRKNFRFVPARHKQLRVARLFLRFEQAVFVEPQAALNRPLAHDDVVLLAAGEIRKRKRKFLVAHHAQVALNATVHNDAGLCFTLGGDFDDARLRDKPPNYLRRPFRRCQQINVADDFLDPPQTAGSTTSDDVRMPAQTVE